MKSFTGYMVYFQSADSYHSTPNLPVCVFTDEDAAIEFAKAQGGYGYGVDWMVKPIEVVTG